MAKQNNQFEAMTHHQRNRTAVQDIAEGLNDLGVVKDEEPVDQTAQLRQIYEKDPERLNPLQLMQIGQQDADKQRQKVEGEQKKNVQTYMDGEGGNE